MPEERSPGYFKAIKGVQIAVDCPYCKGSGRVRGGKVEYGEMITCPMCHGDGNRLAVMSIADFTLLIARKLGISKL